MEKFQIGKFCFIFAILGISYFLMMDVLTAREFNSKLKELPTYVPLFAKYNDYIQENFQYIRTLVATILVKKHIQSSISQCSGCAILLLPSPLVCGINILILSLMAIVYYSRNYFEASVYQYAPNVFNFIGIIGGFFLLMGEPGYSRGNEEHLRHKEQMNKLIQKEQFDFDMFNQSLIDQNQESIEVDTNKIDKKED